MMNGSNYSLSDIAAATGSNNRANDMWGGDGFSLIWLVLIFAIFGWGGFGGWDAEKETIMIQCRPQDGDQGELLDIRETQRVEYTTMNLLSDEWIVADEKNCPVLGGKATFSFGEAIKYLKRGMRVAREGWNGKKQYIQLATGISYKTSSGEIVNCEHDAIGNMAIAFVGTSGVQMGWLASQADMLAEDWVFAE